MPHDPLTTLNDMLQACYNVQKFTKNVDEEAFYQNDVLYYAVVHQLIMVGEAANRLPKPFQQNHSDIPWSDIIGMRNILIHAYDDVNFDDVWYAVKRSVPRLIGQLKPLVPEEETI